MRNATTQNNAAVSLDDCGVAGRICWIFMPYSVRRTESPTTQAESNNTIWLMFSSVRPKGFPKCWLTATSTPLHATQNLRDSNSEASLFPTVFSLQGDYMYCRSSAPSFASRIFIQSSYQNISDAHSPRIAASRIPRHACRPGQLGQLPQSDSSTASSGIRSSPGSRHGR